MKKLLLTQSEVCKLLGIGKDILEIWIKKDGFPKPLDVSDYCGNRGYGGARKHFSFKHIEEWIDKKQKEQK